MKPLLITKLFLFLLMNIFVISAKAATDINNNFKLIFINKTYQTLSLIKMTPQTPHVTFKTIAGKTTILPGEILFINGVREAGANVDIKGELIFSNTLSRSNFPENFVLKIQIPQGKHIILPIVQFSGPGMTSKLINKTLSPHKGPSDIFWSAATITVIPINVP